MKILLDPINTNAPHLCSCNWKLRVLVEELLKMRDDVCFYYVVPKNDERNSWEVEKDWWIDDPRITYIEIPAYKDRMVEYGMVHEEFLRHFAFNGEYWDWDMMITARSLGVAHMRFWGSRQKRGWTRWISVMEEMPILSFKKRVNQPDPGSQDLQVLSSYLMANRTYTFTTWQRAEMLQLARKVFPPSKVMAMDDKIDEASLFVDPPHYVKPPEYLTSVMSREKKFTVVHPQRFGRQKDDYRLTEAMTTMQKYWTMYGGTEDDIRLLALTNSRNADTAEFSGFEVQRCRREQFWDKMKHEADVFVAISNDEDFPLSLIEPLLLGVPGIIGKAIYTDATFPEYPFMVSGEAQTYAMIRQFYENYDELYKTFADWQTNVFLPFMRSRADKYWPTLVSRDIDEHLSILNSKATVSSNEESLANLTMKYIEKEGLTEFILTEVFSAVAKKHDLGTVAQYLTMAWERKPFSISPSWQDIRLRMLATGRYKDASAKPGHMLTCL